MRDSKNSEMLNMAKRYSRKTFFIGIRHPSHWKRWIQEMGDNNRLEAKYLGLLSTKEAKNIILEDDRIYCSVDKISEGKPHLGSK